MTSLVARAISLAAIFAMVPIALRSLGTAEFGVFLAVSSAVALLGFTDLGIGHGLVSSIATASAENDHATVQRLVSTAVLVLVAVAAGGIAVTVLLAALASGPVGSPFESRETLLSVAAASVITFAGLPLTVAASVRLGLQESAASNAWLAASGLVQLGGVSMAAALDLGLMAFVIALVGGGVVTDAGDTLTTLFGRRRWLRPRLRLADRAMVPPLLRKGGLFFVLALAGAVAFNADLLIITAVLGPEAAAQYGVAFRLFSLAPLVTGFFLTPLWPAYADALHRRDVPWVRQTLRRSLLQSVAFTAAVSVVLVFSARSVIELWVGTDLGVPTMLLLALAAQAIIFAVSTPLAMYLNGTGAVRFQAVVAVAMAAVNLPLSVVLAEAMGVSGPVWATVAAQTLIVLVPCMAFVPRHLAQLSLR